MRRGTASCFGECRPDAFYALVCENGGDWGYADVLDRLSNNTHIESVQEQQQPQSGKEQDLKNGWIKLDVQEQVEKIGHFPVFDISFTPPPPPTTTTSSDAIMGPCTLLLTSDKRIGWQGVLEKVTRNNATSAGVDISKQISELKNELFGDAL